jgi:hypothetical protein
MGDEMKGQMIDISEERIAQEEAMDINLLLHSL